MEPGHHRLAARALTLAALLGIALLGCDEPDGAGDAAPGDGGGADAGPLMDGSTSDAGTDGGPAEFCASAEDGAECGERRECSGGRCVFTEPDTPCDYDFASAPADAYLVIACDHDLAGLDVEIAAGVTLDYNGGSIRNGTLSFLEGARIHGELLRIDLDVDTADGGALIDPSFVLRPERWDLVEGAVSDEVATSNREHLRAAIERASALGGTTFTVGALDVFLEVGAGPYHLRFLELPSDFHLQMSDETHLRVQPNANFEYRLITCREQSNVRITGGHLWGDRYTHLYDESHPHDQGIGIRLGGCRDVLIEGLTANQFTGDGLGIGAGARRNEDGSPQDGHQYGGDVTVRDCVFDDNRRNGLSIVDVEGALLEGLTVSNTALGDPSVDGPSAGTTPRYGLQIEPYQPVIEGSDELQILEEVTDVVIRDSTFTNNHAGDINFFKCHRTEAYGNHFDGTVASRAAYEVNVHDNVFEAGREGLIGVNVSAVVRSSGRHFVRDWQVTANRISGYDQAINMGGENQLVRGNTLEGFRNGVFMTLGVSNRFEDNVLRSTLEGSRGYVHFPRSQASGVISGGSVDVELEPLNLFEFNEALEEGRLEVSGVDFRSSTGAPVTVRSSSHVTVRECSADGFREEDNTDVMLTGNTVR